MEDFFLQEIRDFIEFTSYRMLVSGSANHYNEDEKEDLLRAIEIFVQVAYEVYDALPHEWDKKLIEGMFKEAIPCCVAIPYEALVKVPSQLRDYFDFLGQEGLLYDTKQLIQAVKENEASLLRNAKDKNRWGEGKAINMKDLE